MPQNSPAFEGSHDQHSHDAAHHRKFQPVLRIFFEFWLHGLVWLWIESALQSSMRLGIAIQKKVPNRERIHIAVDEATVSIIRRANDRFPAHVERSVDQHSATG